MAVTVKKLHKMLVEAGPRRILLGVIHTVSEKFYEKYYNLETQSPVKIRNLHDNKSHIQYIPSDFSSLKKIFKHLDLKEDKDVFLDYGSGKGRTLIIAATQPLKRVIGVELSKELNEIAKINVLRARKRMRCKNIECINDDAREYPFPEDVSIVYLWFPFSADILRIVMNNIKLSLMQHPRDLSLIYTANHVQPYFFEESISDRQWLSKKFEFRRWDNIRIVVYQHRDGELS